MDQRQKLKSKVKPQPPPKPADGDVWAELIAALPPDLEALRPLCLARRAFGIAKHCGPLQRENGRDHVVDALQELLDAAVYLRAANLHEASLQVLRLVQLVSVAGEEWDLPW